MGFRNFITLFILACSALTNIIQPSIATPTLKTFYYTNTNHNRKISSNNINPYANVVWQQPKVDQNYDMYYRYHGPTTSVQPYRKIYSNYIPRTSPTPRAQPYSKNANSYITPNTRVPLLLPHANNSTENSRVNFLKDKVNPIPKLEERQENGPEQQKSKSNLPRRPGLPNDIPLPTINISNVVALFELATSDTDPTDLTVQQETLLIQTLSEIATFVGLQDVRDWLGIISMFFVLGPIMIPMLMLPITLIIAGALLIPLVINGANVAAADNIIIVGRRLGLRDGLPSTSPSLTNPLLESYCMEMLSCEVTNLLRTSKMSNWVTRAFSLTSVEWAGPISPQDGNNPLLHQSYYTRSEDCAKYTCKFVQPMQRFFSNWYSYFFTYQKNPTHRTETVLN